MTSPLTVGAVKTLSKLEQAKWSLRIAEQLMYEALESQEVIDGDSIRVAIKKIQNSQLRIEAEQESHWAL